MDEDSLTPEEREKLMQELKQRLREIEELKQALHLIPQEEGGENTPQAPLSQNPDRDPHPISHTRAAIEELKVPPLELLQDTPTPSRKQGKAATP